jgi:hypothetical protein
MNYKSSAVLDYQPGLKCCSARHLVKSGLALAIYDKLSQLCHGNDGKGEYFGGLEGLAKFFRVPYNSVWRAFKYLRAAGFLIVTDTEFANGWQERHFKFKRKTYRVILHTEWAETHPGQCEVELVMPWDGLGDLLAQRLFRASGGKTRWFENMLKSLRRTGLSDDEIVARWEGFIAERKNGTPLYDGQWHSMRGLFLRQMKELISVAA